MWKKVDFSFFRDNQTNPMSDSIIWIALTALVCGQSPEGALVLTDGLTKYNLTIDEEVYENKMGKRQVSRLSVGDTFNFINLSYEVATGALMVMYVETLDILNHHFN